MELFNFGNLIVLIIALLAIAVTRRLDQQNRSVELTKRFFDKARKDFDDYVAKKQGHLNEMTTGFDSFEKNSREMLAYIKEEARLIAGEGAKLNEVRDLVVQLLAERDRVFDGINNLKEDGKFVKQLGDGIELVAKKIKQVEEEQERLLNDLLSRNQANLLAEKEQVLSQFFAESALVRAAIEQESAAAINLKEELAKVLEQKDESLIRSLKVYKGELERIDGLYSDKLRQLEYQAKAMESEGLFAIKENLEGQFAKVKNLSEEMFTAETDRFRADLAEQINEFEAFTGKYRAIEDDLARRYEELGRRMAQAELEQEGFITKMHGLSDYMDNQFSHEAAGLNELLINKIAALATKVGQSEDEQFGNLEYQIKAKAGELAALNERLDERMASLEVETQHYHDQIEARFSEFSGQITTNLANYSKQYEDSLTNFTLKYNQTFKQEDESLRSLITEYTTGLQEAIEASKLKLTNHSEEWQVKLDGFSEQFKHSFEQENLNLNRLVSEQGNGLSEAINNIELALSRQRELWANELSESKALAEEQVAAHQRLGSEQKLALEEMFNELRFSTSEFIIDQKEKLSDNFNTAFNEERDNFINLIESLREEQLLLVNGEEARMRDKLSSLKTGFEEALTAEQQRVDSAVTALEEVTATTASAEQAKLKDYLAEVVGTLTERLKTEELHFNGVLNSLKEQLGTQLEDERAEIDGLVSALQAEFAEIKTKVHDAIAGESEAINLTVKRLIDEALAKVIEQTGTDITNLDNYLTVMLNEAKEKAGSLNQDMQSFDKDAGRKVAELETFFNTLISDLQAKADLTLRKQEEWQGEFELIHKSFNEEFKQSEAKLHEDLQTKILQLEQNNLTLWTERWQEFEQKAETKAEAALNSSEQLAKQFSDELTKLNEEFNGWQLGFTKQLTVNQDKLAEIADDVSALERDYQANFSELVGKSNHKLAEVSSYLDKLTADFSGQLTQSIEESNDKLAKARSYADEMAESWRAQLEALSFEVRAKINNVENESEVASKNYAEKLNHKLALWQQESRTILQESEEQLNATKLEIEGFKANLSNKLAQHEAELGNQLNLAVTGLEESKTKFNSELKEHFTDFKMAGEELMSYGKEKVSAIEAQLNEVGEQWQSSLLKSEEELAAKLAAFNEALSKQAYNQQNELTNQLNEWQQQNEQFIEQAGNQSEELAADLTYKITGLKEQFNLTSQQLGQLANDESVKLAQLKNDLAEQLTKFAGEQEANFEFLQSNYDEQLAHFKAFNEEEQAKALFKTKQLSEQLEQNFAGYSELSVQQLKDFEELLQANSRLTEEQLAGHSHYLNEEFTKIKLLGETELEEAKVGIEEVKADFNRHLTAQLEALTSGNTELQSRFKDVSAELYNQLDIFKQEINANQDNLNLMAKDNQQQFNLRQEELFKQLNQLELNLSALVAAKDEKLLAQKERLTNELTGFEATLERRLAEALVQSDERVVQQQRLADELLEQFIEQLAGFKAETDAQLAALNGRQELTQAEWQQRYNLISENYEAMLVKAGAEAGEWQARFNERFKELDNRLKERLSLVTTGIDERLNQVDVQAELIEGAWAERYERYTNDLAERLAGAEGSIEQALVGWQNRLSGVEASLNERLGEASRLSNEVEGAWRASFEELQQTMNARSLASQQEVDALEKLWQERFASAQRLITERLENSHDWAGEVEERWQEQYNKLLATINERTELGMEAAKEIEASFKEQYNQLLANFTGKQQEIKTSFDSYLKDITKQNEEWQATLEASRLVITESGLSLESEWKEKFAALTEQLDIHFKDVTGESQKLEESWQNYLEKVDISANEHLNEAEARLKLLEEEWQQRGSKAINQLKEKLDVVEQESAALLLRLDEKNNELDDEYNHKLNYSKQKLSELELAWEERYRLLEESLAAKQLLVSDNIEVVKENLEQKVKDFSNLSDEQLAQMVAESEQLEERWQLKLASLNSDLESWLTEAEKNSTAYAKQLTEAWDTRFNNLAQAEENRLKEAELEAKKIEYFWQERIDGLNRLLTTKIAQLEAEFANYTGEVTEGWQQRLDDFKAELAEKLSVTVDSNNQLETHYNEQLEQQAKLLNSKIEENNKLLVKSEQEWQTKIADSFRLNDEKLAKLSEETAANQLIWQERFEQFTANLTKQSEQIEAKSEEFAEIFAGEQERLSQNLAGQVANFEEQLELKQDELREQSESFANEGLKFNQYLSNLKTEALNSIGGEKAAVKEQIKSELKELAQDMRDDWEISLADLKGKLDGGLNEGLLLLDELKAKASSASAEQAGFSEQLKLLLAEAQQLFINNKEQIVHLSGEADSHFEAWHKHYGQQLTQLFESLNAQSGEVAAGKEALQHELAALNNFAEEQRKESEQNWQNFIKQFKEERLAFVSANQEELDRLQSDFSTLMDALQEKEEAIEELFADKSAHFNRQSKLVDGRFNELLTEQEQLFNDQKQRFEALTLSFNERFTNFLAEQTLVFNEEKGSLDQSGAHFLQQLENFAAEQQLSLGEHYEESLTQVKQLKLTFEQFITEQEANFSVKQQAIATLTSNLEAELAGFSEEHHQLLADKLAQFKNKEDNLEQQFNLISEQQAKLFADRAENLSEQDKIYNTELATIVTGCKLLADEKRQAISELSDNFVNSYNVFMAEERAKLESKVSELLNYQASLDEAVANFDEEQAKLLAVKAKQLNDELNLFKDKLAGKIEGFTAEAGVVWQNFLTNSEDKEQAIEQQFNNYLANLNVKFSQFEGDLAARSDAFTLQFEQKMAKLNEQFNENYQDFNLRNQNFNDNFEQRINEAFGQLDTLEDRLALKQEAFEASFSHELSEAAAHLKKVQAEFAGKKESFDSAFSEQMARAKSYLGRMEEEFTQRQGDFDVALQVKIDEAAANVLQLEAEFAAKRTSFEQDLNRSLQQAEHEVSQLRQSFAKQHEEVEADFKERINTTLSVVDKLESQLIAKGQHLDTLISSTLVNVESELIELKANLLNKQEQSFEQLNHSLTTTTVGFEERLAKAEQLVSERSLTAENYFTELEIGFNERRSGLEVMLKQLENNLKERLNSYNAERESLSKDFKLFKDNMAGYIEEREQFLRQNIENNQNEAENRLSRLIFEQFEEAERKLSAMLQLIDNAEQEAEQRLMSQRDGFNLHFTKLEELISTASFDLKSKEQLFMAEREKLEEELHSYRRLLVDNLKQQENELKLLIESSVAQTGDDLSLEFMSSLEARLNDYEEVLRVRLNRIENFIHDIDSLEGNLRLSMKDTQDNVLRELGIFENDIRVRQEREIERASQLVITAQEAFNRVIEQANSSISSLQGQIEELRRKALDNVTGKLTDFEEGFLDEINKREANLLERVTAWQAAINEAMASFEQRKQQERGELEERFTTEQQNFMRDYSQKMDNEFNRFNNEIEQLAASLNKQAGTTDKQLQKLQSNFDTQVTDLNKDVEQQLAALTAHLEEHSGSAYEQLQNLQNNLAEQIANLNKDFSNKLSSNLANYEAAWQGKLTTVQSKLDEQLQLINRQLSGEQEVIKERLTVIYNESEQSITGLKAELERQVSQIAGSSLADREALQSEYNRLESEAAQLISRLEERQAAVTLALEQLSGEVMTKLQKSSAEANDLLQKNSNEAAKQLQKSSSEALATVQSYNEEVIDKLQKSSGEITGEFYQQFNNFEGALQAAGNKLNDFESSFAAKISGKLEHFTTQIELAEQRQASIESNMATFKQAERLRSELEGALIDLSERMAKVEGRREEVLHLQSQLDKAFKINESLAEKLASMARERERFNELDERIAHITQLAGSVDERMQHISSTSSALNEIQNKLRALDEYEQQLSIKLMTISDRFKQAEGLAEHTGKSADKLQALQGDMALAMRDLTAMQDELSALTGQFAQLQSNAPEIDQLVTFFKDADVKLNDMEERANRIDQMRDWMVTAEKQFMALQNDVKGSLSAIGRGSGLSGLSVKEPDSNEEAIIKLAEQGWAVARIAGHMKMSQTEVQLILERSRKR